MKGNVKKRRIKSIITVVFKGHSEQVAEESVRVTDSACFIAIGRMIYFSSLGKFLSPKEICQNPLVLLS